MKNPFNFTPFPKWFVGFMILYYVLCRWIDGKFFSFESATGSLAEVFIAVFGFMALKTVKLSFQQDKIGSLLAFEKKFVLLCKDFVEVGDQCIDMILEYNESSVPVRAVYKNFTERLEKIHKELKHQYSMMNKIHREVRILLNYSETRFDIDAYRMTVTLSEIAISDFQVACKELIAFLAMREEPDPALQKTKENHERKIWQSKSGFKDAIEKIEALIFP